MPNETLRSTPQGSQLHDLVLDWLQTSVIRVILTRVVPLIIGAGVVNAVLAWLQKTIGLNLPPAVVASWVGTSMAGVVAVAFAYVKNHAGAAYLGKALLELETLFEAGRQAVGDVNVPPKVYASGDSAGQSDQSGTSYDPGTSQPPGLLPQE